MGKRLIQQARGKGGPRYKTPSHRFVTDSKYLELNNFREGGVMQVIDIVTDPVRSAPIAKLLSEDFRVFYMIAPIGISVGDLIEFGESVDANPGNITLIENIKEGTPIYNLELVPGDGGKLVRASGLAAYVISQDPETKKTVIRLPSKRKVTIDWGCRATIGTVAGSGRTEKPLVKAGNKFKDQKSRGKLYPRTSGTAMNAQDHPFGGRTNIGRSSSAKKNAPPGAKVGHLAPKRTGVRRTRAKEQTNG
jgi:large subunit ribosomal protein L2